MLKFKCRQRLKYGAKYRSISEAIHSPILGPEWEFLIESENDDYIKEVKVNDIVVFSEKNCGQNNFVYFVLPASASNLTRIDVETRGFIKDSLVLDVINGYQLPETVLANFRSCVDLYKKISLGALSKGDFSVLDLAEGDETISSEDKDSDIKKNDIPKHIRTELSELFVKLLKRPNTRLIEEKILVEPGELQRVTPATIDYFIRHPETWHNRGYLRPRPTRLLDDRTKEDYDIYENRFALHFLETLVARLNTLIDENLHLLTEAEIRYQEDQIYLNQGLFGIRSQAIKDLEQQLNQRKQNLSELKKFRSEIQGYITNPIFCSVLRLYSLPQANTVLRLHPIYGRLYTLYELIEQESFTHNRIKVLEEINRNNIIAVYQGYCFAVIYQAIKENLLDNHLFELVPQSEYSPVDGIGKTSTKKTDLNEENLVLKFKSLLLEHSVIITLTLLRSPTTDASLIGSTLVEVKKILTDEDSIISRIWLIPQPIWWGSATISVEEKHNSLQEIYVRLGLPQFSGHG